MFIGAYKNDRTRHELVPAPTDFVFQAGGEAFDAFVKGKAAKSWYTTVPERDACFQAVSR